MPSLTRPRNTTERYGDCVGFTVAPGVTIFQGALVALEAGNAVPGKTALSLVAIGRAERVVTDDQTGVSKVEVKRGTFRYENSSTDRIEHIHVGSDCYIVDDQTVAKTDGGGTRSRAGKVVDVELLGVWVKIGLSD
jgi:hypothetical protein